MYLLYCSLHPIPLTPSHPNQCNSELMLQQKEACSCYWWMQYIYDIERRQETGMLGFHYWEEQTHHPTHTPQLPSFSTVSDQWSQSQPNASLILKDMKSNYHPFSDWSSILGLGHIVYLCSDVHKLPFIHWESTIWPNSGVIKPTSQHDMRSFPGYQP